MDSFEINKIFGAICATALFILVLTIVTDFLYSEPELEQQAYIVDVPDMDMPVADDTLEVVEVDVMELLVMASLENGQKVAKKCVSCHNFEAGSANKIGPNLYNIVDRQMGIMDGFAYSNAINERGANNESWTFENLFHFLENPKKWLPGTIMGYAGIRKPKDRADLIVYLHDISPDSESTIE
ncbi:MAG: cytochrome c family protein [Pseudomonadota bacterium]|jgi:cytochrome c|nr:cytochrome c family protein [Pseudomonadota bacterium]|tara:strand:+ start:466 stop:1014 length:549 start_codon:yes stop_codon:yes gene_type:complete